MKTGSILTDTCSVKKGVGKIFDKINLKNSICIPSHPVAGIENSGPKAGIADLFKGRWTILTPNKNIDQKSIIYNISRPLKLIYISTVNLYKHQWRVVEVVDELNKNGFFIDLTLIGDNQYDALNLLNNKLNELGNPKRIKYLGPKRHDELQKFYCNSDVFIFASTCETFGMVILEAMSCGLPVLSSKQSSMPSTFKDVPLYFDPFKIESIKKSIKKIYNNPKLLLDMSEKSFSFSKNFSWKNTSEKTFVYLASVSKFIKN